jgi:hypothetical protein
MECEDYGICWLLCIHVCHLHRFIRLQGESMSRPPRLACQQCKSRKIECDKNNPCSACRSKGHNSHIVQRARLCCSKIGKEPTRNRSLAARVARIESLVEERSERAESQSPMLDQTLSPNDLENTGTIDAASKKIADLVTPSF